MFITFQTFASSLCSTKCLREVSVLKLGSGQFREKSFNFLADISWPSFVGVVVMIESMKKQDQMVALQAKVRYVKQHKRKMSMRKALEKLMKRCAVVGIITGEDMKRCHWSCTFSFACYKGKVILGRPSLDLVTDLRLRRSLQYYLPSKKFTELRDSRAAEFGRDASYSAWTDQSVSSCLFEEKKVSTISPEMSKDSLGWPLLLGKKKSSLQHSQNDETRVSTLASVLAAIVRKVCLRPNRIAVKFDEDSQGPSRCARSLRGRAHAHGRKNEVLKGRRCFNKTRNLAHGYKVPSGFSSINAEVCPSPAQRKLINKLRSCGAKKFGYNELMIATAAFSLENLIGEGGCSNVYKGVLPSGKSIAIRILKPYRDASHDFYIEVSIVSALKHKNVSPLLGVCTENGHRISIYDFFPKGSLDEKLHGQHGSDVMQWDARFKLAVATAEALNYLHNETPCPVIHRDIKPSNILLSNDLQPQLSDFGLAMWRPEDSSDVIESTVVGTFGYLAPEYIMEGRVSEKIDVYSFGVVLLELLSGRRPISKTFLEGQQSLVQWAKSLLEMGNPLGLVDPELNGNFRADQILKIVLAGAICISQEPQSRPDISKVLELLRGERNPRQWYEEHVNSLQLSSYPAEDFPPNMFAQFDLLFPESEAAKSLSNNEGANKHERRPTLKLLLKEPQD